MLKLKSDDLRISLETAQNYVKKVGAPQRHFGKDSKGVWHTCEVKTVVNHQEYSGGTNYHNCKEFDLALQRVVKESLPELAAKALTLMRKEYEQQLEQEEAFFKSKLDEVARAKAAAMKY